MPITIGGNIASLNVRPPSLVSYGGISLRPRFYKPMGVAQCQ